MITGNNHHLEVIEVTGAKGRPKWEGKVVTLFEAMERKKVGLPVIQRDHGPGARFVFSLAPGELITLPNDNGDLALFRIRTVTSQKKGEKIYPTIVFCRVNDARLKKDMRAEKAWFSLLMEPFRKKGGRKVTVTPLGEVRRAND